MKRIGNLFNQICSIENLHLADQKARKGKSAQYGVQHHDKNREDNIISLHHQLLNKEYTTSAYTVFKIYDPKERDVYRLPYYPDRIVHHAIMNLLEPIFVSTFTADTYSCIKGRGIHAAVNKFKKAVRNQVYCRYCLKLDIKKFYPSVDRAILKALIRRKIKDKDLLELLDDIIDSAEGLPIGNYLSQYLANYYLTYFDHWIKEVKGVKYYFRYADDMVILADNKQYLHSLLADIKTYLSENLNLTVKENYQLFPVAARGIDFLGYVFKIKPTVHTILRKSIKRRFVRRMAKKKKPKLEMISAYYGWAKHCNSNHLLKKLIPNEQFQRFRNKAEREGLRRRENQNRPDT